MVETRAHMSGKSHRDGPNPQERGSFPRASYSQPSHPSHPLSAAQSRGCGIPRPIDLNSAIDIRYAATLTAVDTDNRSRSDRPSQGIIQKRPSLRDLDMAGNLCYHKVAPMGLLSSVGTTVW
jgi:hypothetical protein